eukprot:Transcript_5124.p4 GENE.Transcript_5124~~Transcript_5124.p4  ORF type:complete len:87 (+),score=31.11 Transcript_5124:361-621(+)
MEAQELLMIRDIIRASQSRISEMSRAACTSDTSVHLDKRGRAQLEHIRAERRHDRRSPRVVVNALAAEKDDEENERPRTIRPWPEP